MERECKHPTCGNVCRREKKQKKIYHLPKKSTTRKSEDKIYHELRPAFLKAHPVCEIKSPECTGVTTCVHHTRGRGIYLLAQNTWMGSCRRCNNYVEDHDAWAREKGFKKSKFTPLKEVV